MGKLICDSTTSSPVIPWRNPTSTPTVNLVDQTSPAPLTTTSSSWDDVSGLEEQQKRYLNRLLAKGVLWKHPKDQNKSLVFRLSHGGEVDADGNCLFTATRKAMGSSLTARDLRRRTVRRFLEDLGSASQELREKTESLIKHLYTPDLNSGWGVHVIQEVKLLARKEDRLCLDSSINELLQLDMPRHFSCFLMPLVQRGFFF